MAKSSQERRAQRDTYARSQTNPDTGQPFRNYNALDTYQRNQKAKATGGGTRSQQRYAQEKNKAEKLAEKMPGSFAMFLGTRQKTVKLTQQFEKAWGPGPVTASRAAARAAFFEAYEDGDYDIDWNWREWEAEYSEL